jgi:hydroxymethylbilane synthase
MRIFSADGSGADRILAEALSPMVPEIELAGQSSEDPGAGEVSASMLRNVPLSIGGELSVAAVLKRADRRYASFPCALDVLPKGVAVAASDPCAAYQLAESHPESTVISADGVQGCLEELHSGVTACMVAPIAELGMLGPTDDVFPVDADVLVPAATQGVVSAVCRKDDHAVLEALGRLEHRPTRIEIGAERGILRMMGAGPFSPAGVSASIEDVFVHVKAVSYICDEPRRVDEYLMPDYVMDDLLGIAEYLNGKRGYVMRCRHRHKR